MHVHVSNDQATFTFRAKCKSGCDQTIDTDYALILRWFVFHFDTDNGNGVVALCLLANLLPDSRSKPDSDKITLFTHVSMYLSVVLPLGTVLYTVGMLCIILGGPLG